MPIAKHIPNFFTCLNLICGSIGVVVVLQSQSFNTALLLICLAGFFDFLDGFIARLLKVHSPIGKELDSLADMVTFGLLPAMIVYSILERLGEPLPVKLTGLIIAVFSALRLAKFNVDDRQSTSFIGLPTPANAFFISGLPPFILGDGFGLFNYISPTVFTIVLSLVFSILMVAEIKMLALKFTGFGWKENKWKYGLISGSLMLIIVFQLNALPMVIILYLVLSFLHNTVGVRSTFK